MIEASIRELLLKIKALAERGASEGERAAARGMLERKLAALKITLADLEHEEKEIVWFIYANEQERRVIAHIMMRLFDLDSFYKSPLRKKRAGYELTKAQTIEAAEWVRHYLSAFREDWRVETLAYKKRLSLMSVAFVNKHKLFSTNEAVGGGPKKKTDIEEIRSILVMMEGLKEVNPPRAKMRSGEPARAIGWEKGK